MTDLTIDKVNFFDDDDSDGGSQHYVTSETYRGLQSLQSWPAAVPPLPLAQTDSTQYGAINFVMLELEYFIIIVFVPVQH